MIENAARDWGIQTLAAMVYGNAGLQTCVAALVNVESVEAVDAEMKRRAVVGN